MQDSTIEREIRTARGSPLVLPKIIGCDAEVANFIAGLDESGSTGKEASIAVIREVRGHTERFGGELPDCPCGECDRARKRIGSDPETEYDAFLGEDGKVYLRRRLPAGRSSDNGHNPRDHDRSYLAETGGCFYIDLDHVEVCLPETRSAFDYVACWHAALRLLRSALDAANSRLPEGQKIHILVNASDGLGHSYGSHLNFLITERCRENIFDRRVQYLLYLAAYQVSSIVFAGQGKVGSERGEPLVEYQLSQRADFFECIVGAQTTCARPIVNSRDEPHCGTAEHRSANVERPETGMARLHVIFYDSTLCQVATLLKVGVMQIVLAMIEAETANPRLILDDPVAALRAWGEDPTLQAKALLCNGRRTTALDLQSRFFDEAARFAARGGCDGIVPRAGEILDLWADTLEKLRARDFPALAGRLDWVAKRLLLEAVLGDRQDLDWRHPTIKQLDQLYSSLDPDDGLFWTFDRQGLIEKVVTDERIDHFVSNPPEDTRAWTRAMLLRRGGTDRIAGVGWDSIRCVVRDERGFYEHRIVDLANPLGFTRDFSGRIFEKAPSFDAVVDALRSAAFPRSTH